MNPSKSRFLFIAFVALTGCSNRVSSDTCSARFAALIGNVPSVGGSLTASFVFEDKGDNRDPEAFRNVTSVDVVHGDGKTKTDDFEGRDFSKGKAMMVAGGESLIGFNQSVKSASDAVREGCALEHRYGTLRTVRLSTVQSSTLTKNEH